MASDSNPQSNKPPNGSSKPDIPATRLFKIMNPELYMKPNKWIMYGGAVAMAGIILWIGSGEIQYRRQQALLGTSADNASSNQRKQTYQEKLAELKRS
ncbi:hypothetical protein EV183_000479 [Coemansia sp. RSA 2336]|nr:hypothetical protein EV183_000479 [Coemansia sp. RSA 2336]